MIGAANGLVARASWDLARLLQSGEVSAVEVTEAFLSRIDEVEGSVNGYITTTADRARRTALSVDHTRGVGGDMHPLSGIPIALKDLLCTKDIATTAGSRMLANYIPPYDATVVARINEACMPLLGKTNMDEFAMGSSNETSAFGVARNPWNLDRVPGGSSGGTAAIVAAGEAPWALGSDTGGSVRQPAALCGVVGLKPTYGLVSRYGLIAFASSLDQIGPITKDVRDAALLLNLIAGHDPLDSTSIPDAAVDFTSRLEDGVKGMHIGIVRELMGEGVQQGVRERVEEAIERLEQLGAICEEISLSSFEYALDAYYLIAPAEASSNLARYDGVRYGLREPGEDVSKMSRATRAAGFGAEVKRRILLGTFCLSAGYYEAWYGLAQKIRTRVVEDFDRAYKDFDLLVSPTSPTTAFSLGERTDDPIAMYLSDVCTIPVNLAGSAAISIPCGHSRADGLPVGFQFMSRPLDEARMLRAAYALEQDLAPLPALGSLSESGEGRGR